MREKIFKTLDEVVDASVSRSTRWFRRPSSAAQSDGRPLVGRCVHFTAAVSPGTTHIRVPSVDRLKRARCRRCAAAAYRRDNAVTC